MSLSGSRCRSAARADDGGPLAPRVPTTAQDWIVFQAGTPLGWLSTMVGRGSLVAASTLASASGRPLAKQAGNRFSSAARDLGRP